MRALRIYTNDCYIEEELYIEEIYEEILIADEFRQINQDLPLLDDVLMDHFEHEELIENFLIEILFFVKVLIDRILRSILENTIF